MPETNDLEALIARLATIDAISQSSEQATREMAVNPVIGALGWDTFDPDEVAREYPVRDGRVDYCLRLDRTARVLVEVKRAGTDLTEHQEQLLRYAFDAGADLAVLTDGLVWWLYLPGETRSAWEQRRFFSVDFIREPPAEAAASLSRFLGREATASGAAITEAQQEFRQIERDRRVRGALPDAWERVLSDPEGLIIDLLIDAVEEISGHPPSKETVTEFLAGKLGSVTVEHPPTSVRTSRRRGRGARSASVGRSTTASTPTSPKGATDIPAPTSFKGRRVAAYWLDGVRHEVNSWRALLPRLCGQLAREAGRAFPQAVTRLEGQPYLRTSAPNSPDWVLVGGTDRYVYVNITGDVAVERSRRILRAVRGSDDGFHIESVGQQAPATRSSSARANASGTPLPKSLTGLRPAAFILDGTLHEVTSWRRMLVSLSEQLVSEDGGAFEERVLPLKGRKRSYFSRKPADLVAPLAISGSGLYVEGNLSANDCASVARRVLIAVRGSVAGFEIRPAEESTP